MLNDIIKGISSTNGRLSRILFLKIFIFNILGYILIGFLGPIIFDPANVQYSNYVFFLKIPFIAFGLIASINRFHDMNKSGWFILLELIPFVNFGIIIWLLIGKGTGGENKYGKDLSDIKKTINTIDKKEL